MANGICQLHELSIAFQDGRARTFVFGRTYDLDQLIDGVPLRKHLGPLAEKFIPETIAAGQSQSVATPDAKSTTTTPAKAKESR